MAKHSNKIVVVTGGTGALGKVVVEYFLKTNAVVIATHTGNKSANKFISDKRKQFPKFSAQKIDVTSEKSIRRFYNSIISRYKRIDILCNLVGGVSKKKFIEDVTLTEWNKMISLNLQSCFLMTKFAIPSMKRNRFGRIINIASMPAVSPEAQRGGYGVAKSGVVALTKTVAEEVKEFGNITVNAIAPSIILTEENKKWGTEEEFKKWVTPEQISEMMLHLCSDSGAAINGQVIQMFGKV